MSDAQLAGVEAARPVLARGQPGVPPQVGEGPAPAPTVPVVTEEERSGIAEMLAGALNIPRQAGEFVAKYTPDAVALEQLGYRIESKATEFVEGLRRDPILGALGSLGASIATGRDAVADRQRAAAGQDRPPGVRIDGGAVVVDVPEDDQLFVHYRGAGYGLGGEPMFRELVSGKNVARGRHTFQVKQKDTPIPDGQGEILVVARFGGRTTVPVLVENGEIREVPPRR